MAGAGEAGTAGGQDMKPGSPVELVTRQKSRQRQMLTAEYCRGRTSKRDRLENQVSITGKGQWGEALCEEEWSGRGEGGHGEAGRGEECRPLHVPLGNVHHRIVSCH